NQLYPSRISAFDAAATEILFYNFGGAGAVQAVHPGSEAKIVYFAFGYEAIDNLDDRNLVMSNVMTWFGATSVPDEQILPEKPLILYNYPNPFSSSTTIFYNLTAENSQNAEISIYNVKGQKVRTFTEQQISRSSDQQITWNGRDNNDKPLASGLYFYRLSIDNYSMTKKMILTK
nr:T9SS type A sorting domain-containing protein [Candidatus Cloacimonadota bacterium]